MSIWDGSYANRNKSGYLYLRPFRLDKPSGIIEPHVPKCHLHNLETPAGLGTAPAACTSLSVKKHHLILLFSCFSGFVPITSCFIFQDSQCSFTFPVPKTSLLFFPLVKQGCFIQFPSCISLPLFHHLCDPFCRARSAAVPGKCREQGTPVSPGVCHTWHPESRISRETGTGAGAGESRGDWRADRTSSSWESTEMQ